MKMPAKVSRRRITVVLSAEASELLATYESYMPKDASVNITSVVNETLSEYLHSRIAEYDSPQ